MIDINKDEIRKAIDRLQDEHPCHFAYNPTTFESMENVNSLSHAIDMVAKRMGEDSEINIICEFAKLYLDGVKPTVYRPHGEWIVQRNKQGLHIYSVCSNCNVPYLDTDFPNFCPNCGARMKEGDEK